MRKAVENLWRLVTFNTETKAGFIIVATFVLASIVVEVAGYRVLPYNPLKPFTGKPFSLPSLSHPFGTDNLGHDVFSGVVAGAPNDAMVSFFVVGFSFLVGGSLGSLAGYVGGTHGRIVDESNGYFLRYTLAYSGYVYRDDFGTKSRPHNDCVSGNLVASLREALQRRSASPVQYALC